MNKRMWQYLGFFMILAMWHPLAAFAAEVLVAASPVAAAASKFLDFSTLNLSSVGLPALGVYAAIEGWLAHRLDGTPYAGLKRYVPAVFSFLTWLAGGLAAGATPLTILGGALSTTLGSMLTHDFLGNLGGFSATVAGGAINMVQSLGQPGPITEQQYRNLVAKGNALVHAYNPDGSVKAVVLAAPVVVPQP